MGMTVYAISYKKLNFGNRAFGGWQVVLLKNYPIKKIITYRNDLKGNSKIISPYSQCLKSTQDEVITNMAISEACSPCF